MITKTDELIILLKIMNPIKRKPSIVMIVVQLGIIELGRLIVIV